jgi:probable RNA-binding protein EIF1AD
MSGVKRRSKYRKNVTDEVLHGLPEPTASQAVAVVCRSLGSNLVAVETGGGEAGMAMLPTKFRKLVWIKRGDYVIVSQAEGEVATAGGGAGKVRFIIDAVLYAEAVKHLAARGMWPPRFEAAAVAAANTASMAAVAAAAVAEAAAAAGEAGAGAGAGPDGGEEAAGEGEEEGEEGEESEEEEDIVGPARGRRFRGQQGTGMAGMGFGRPGDLPPSRSESEGEEEAEGGGGGEGR